MEDYKNTDVVAVLNELIETLKDGEKGFQMAAQGVKKSDLQQLFVKFAQQRSQFVDELQKEVRTLGGDPEETGSVAGAMHRGWINMKSAVTGQDEEAIIKECERGEDSAVRTYEESFKKNLPEKLRSIVHRQFTQIKEAHDRIRELELRMEALKP